MPSTPPGGATDSGGAEAGPPARGCFDMTRHPPAALKACTTDADCTSLVFDDCCGVRHAVGIDTAAQGCTVPDVDCDTRFCAPPSGYGYAEDDNISVDKVFEVRCVVGQCMTRVTADHRGFLCAGVLCGPYTVCLNVSDFFPPACAPVPMSCAANLDCRCVPPELCGDKVCSYALGDNVYCENPPAF